MPRHLATSLLALALVFPAATPDAEAQDPKTQLAASIDARRAEYVGIANQIWSLAEVGYQEHASSKLLQGELTKAGFKVDAGVAGIPTAFVASYGSGKPVIAVLAEFDALPGLSQAAEPVRKPLVEHAPEHACG